MPTSTVNWLWIGNNSLIDATPASNATQAQLDAAGMTGYTAFGPSQIAPVAVSGTTTGSGGPAGAYRALQPAEQFHQPVQL